MILDLVIVLIILLFTFLGYMKGLVKTAIGILSFFIALIISIVLYKVVGNTVINNTQIDEKIEATISSKILTDDFEKKLAILPESLIESGQNTVEEISKSLSCKIIYIVSFVLLFLALKIALIFVKILAGIITKIPVIKQFDKLRWSDLWFDKRFIYCYSSFCCFVDYITNDR